LPRNWGIFFEFNLEYVMTNLIAMNFEISALKHKARLKKQSIVKPKATVSASETALRNGKYLLMIGG